jgi:hypothetical protein
MDVTELNRKMQNCLAPPSVAETTELERLSGAYGRSTNRLREMIGALESRLDRVTSAPSQGATASTSPSATPGTVASLNGFANDFDILCGALDEQLCRLYKIL